MDKYIGRVLSKRFESKSGTKVEKKQKYVIDLAFETYLNEIATNSASKDGLDRAFVANATTQIKTFIFAGHDITSSTMCYIYHFLSQSPNALRKLRQEHDNAFGPDPAAAADAIKRDPSLLSRLPYILACIKETLRIYPAASSVRNGSPSIHITDPQTGQRYPTHPFMVGPLPHGLHRRPDLFPDPMSFRPARFMPDPPAPFPNPVPKDAWRPFEKGPRNCIGQELAILETKVILTLTVRSFLFTSASSGPGYDGTPGYDGPGHVDALEKGEKYNMIDGERAHRILLGTAKPKSGFPCVVTRVGKKESGQTI